MVWNPLHEYRNYVPHFAIVVLKGTTTANQFFEVDTDNRAAMNKYFHPPGGVATKYDAQGKDKDYAVIFNSMTDAEFYIDKLELTTILQNQGAQVNNGAEIHSLGTEMTMKVVEPYTVDFVTTFFAAQQNLGLSDILTMDFLLKIFFVGYKDSDEEDIISYIAPITFRIQTIDLTLTHAGTEYIVKCILTNNTGNVRSFNEIGGLTFQTGENIGEAIDTLNEKLRQRTDLSDLNIKIDNPAIKYKVFLDPAYRDPKYKISNVLADNQNKYPGTDKKPNVQFVSGRGDSITDSITNIMLLSKAVIEDSNPPNNLSPGEVAKTYIHRIHTQSSKVGNEETIYYYVLRQSMRSTGIGAQPDDSTTDAGIKAAIEFDKTHPQQPKPEPKPPSSNETSALEKAIEEDGAYLVYDYIYTGRNVDVLQFVMNIPMVGNGSPFALYQPNTIGTSIGQTQQASNQQDPTIANAVPKGGHNDPGTVSGYGTKPQPDKVSSSTGVGAIIGDKDNTGRGAADAALFYQGRQILSRFIGDTGISAALEIYGNPILLNTTMIPQNTYLDKQGQGLPPEKVVKNLEKRQTLGALGGAPLSLPLLKLNIRVPKPTYAQGGVFGNVTEEVDIDYENKFSTAFWNYSRYTITTIDHVFEKNRFTQRMKLLLFPVDGMGNVTLHDACPSDSQRKTHPTLSQYEGGMKKKPDAKLQELINKAAASYCMDPKLIEAVMYHESKFDPNAVSSTGCYGYMQMSIGASKDMHVDRHDPLENIAGGVGYLGRMLNEYNGNVYDAIAAWNMGSHAYKTRPVTNQAHTLASRVIATYGSETTKLPCHTNAQKGLNDITA